MFVGHTAVALAAKSRLPQASLGLFFAAAFGLDLIWPIFLLLGIERVRILPGNTLFTPLAFDSYPWSHSLLMAILWGVLASLAVSRWVDGKAVPGMVLLVVVSHWILDFISHRPDMPLWPGNSPLFGLSLWNSVGASLLVEGTLFLIGIFLYVKSSTPKDRVGSIAFWLLIGLSGLMWVSQPWSPPPPSSRWLAWFSLGAWLFPVWAASADRHRTARVTTIS